MKLHKMQAVSTDRTIFYLIGGFTVLVLVIIFIFSVSEGKQTQGAGQVSSYTVSDQKRPKVETSALFSDLGTMKVNEEKKAEFRIENKGSKPLQLSKISSSCGCTVGQLIIGETKSPEFGMHSKSNWVGTIDPGKTATLVVIYRPYVMPVKGVVTRDIYVQTNDPENSKLTFTVKANVQ